MNHENPRILIVDDHKSNRLILLELLSKHNFTTEQAKNGKQALKILQSSVFDLVL